MTRWCRVVSAVTLLLTVLGLPVAPVLCDLACPQASPTVAAVPGPTAARVAAAPGTGSCHDATDVSAAATDHVPAARDVRTAPIADCAHPVVVASAPSGDTVRVPAPVARAWTTATFRLAQLGSQLVPATPALLRPPMDRHGGAFSPVLRI